MKAIETIYNGYRFRSRLEARWAVFFNHIHLKYEYELEGFKLKNGLCYLPDFYIPSIDLYIEIKPSLDVFTLEDALKLESFAEDKRLLLIVGTPNKQHMYYLSNSIYDGQIKELTRNGEYESYKEIIEDGYNDYEVVFATDTFTQEWTLIHKNIRYPSEDYEYYMALLKAQQARFEFGENGK